MQAISINYWALLAFLAARILVGMIWYSPIGFWIQWAVVTKISHVAMKAGMVKGLASDILGSLVMGFVLLFAIKVAGASGNIVEGLKISFFAWLGLVATVQIGMTTYENRPLKFFLIVSGYQLVSMLLGGVALTLWG